MLKISHRGNLTGPSVLENHPDYIREAIDKGFDAEVDVWYKNRLFLGHDYPQYAVDHSFFNERMWIHCKDINAYSYLSRFPKLNIFIHEEGITKSSKGYFMVAPGLELNDMSIALMPELVKDWDISKAFGVCTDYVIS
jgi:hypothetical protein